MSTLTVNSKRSRLYCVRRVWLAIIGCWMAGFAFIIRDGQKTWVINAVWTDTGWIRAAWGGGWWNITRAKPKMGHENNRERWKRTGIIQSREELAAGRSAETGREWERKRNVDPFEYIEQVPFPCWQCSKRVYWRLCLRAGCILLLSTTAIIGSLRFSQSALSLLMSPSFLPLFISLYPGAVAKYRVDPAGTRRRSQESGRAERPLDKTSAHFEWIASRNKSSYYNHYVLHTHTHALCLVWLSTAPAIAVFPVGEYTENGYPSAWHSFIF